VLKTRRVAGVETLILREADRGSLAVRREWTDWDTGAMCEVGVRRLAFESVMELAQLIERLSHPAPVEIDR
jgi:hypothetical protein